MSLDIVGSFQVGFANIIGLVILALPALGMMWVVRPHSKSCSILFATSAVVPFCTGVWMEFHRLFLAEVLLVTFCGSLQVLVGGCFLAGMKNFLSGRKAVLFWILATIAVLLTSYSAFAAYVMMSW